MTDDFQPSEEAQSRPTLWATERMQWDEDHAAERQQLAAKPALIITQPRPVTWLRAARRCRLVIHELSLAVVNIAAAGAACGVCYAVWIIITSFMARGTK